MMQATKKGTTMKVARVLSASKAPKTRISITMWKSISSVILLL